MDKVCKYCFNLQYLLNFSTFMPLCYPQNPLGFCHITPKLNNKYIIDLRYNFKLSMAEKMNYIFNA